MRRELYEAENLTSAEGSGITEIDSISMVKQDFTVSSIRYTHAHAHTHSIKATLARAFNKI